MPGDWKSEERISSICDRLSKVAINLALLGLLVLGLVKIVASEARVALNQKDTPSEESAGDLAEASQPTNPETGRARPRAQRNRHSRPRVDAGVSINPARSSRLSDHCSSPTHFPGDADRRFDLLGVDIHVAHGADRMRPGGEEPDAS